MFTDEKKFKLSGNSLRQYVRRRTGKRNKSGCILPNVKHGGGPLQVELYHIQRSRARICTRSPYALKYKQILIHHAVPVGKALISDNLISGNRENKKRDCSLTVLNSPVQSPDMSIIEQVWTYMEKEKVKRALENLQQLWEVLQDIWKTFQLTLSRNFMTVFHVVLMKCVKPEGSILSIESVIYQFVEIILQNLLSYKKIHEISQKILYKLYMIV